MSLLLTEGVFFAGGIRYRASERVSDERLHMWWPRRRARNAGVYVCCCCDCGRRGAGGARVAGGD